MSIRPNIFMAVEVFFCDVLRILTSDLDEGQNKHSLGIDLRSCVSGMFVIITFPSGGPGDGRLRGPPPGVFNIVRQDSSRRDEQIIDNEQKL